MELAQIGDFGALREQESVSALLDLNRFTAPYGLALTEGQAIALSQNREAALQRTARLEFGGGILPKLILAFRESPNFPGGDPVATISELTDIFYEYKNETMDALTDDGLLSAMLTAFDGPCCGSTELLASRDLAEIARLIRGGAREDEPEEAEDEWN